MLPASLSLRIVLQGVILAGLVLYFCVIATYNLLQGGGISPPSEGVLPSIFGERLEGVVTRITDHSRGFNHTTNDTKALPINLQDTLLQGVVLSMIDTRYNHTKAVLDKLNFVVSRHKPLFFKSAAVSSGLKKLKAGSKAYDSEGYLKVHSNRIAFTDVMQRFVNDKRCDDNSWRFFFEDDIKLHPSLTSEAAQIVLANGMAVAAGDGMVYLGITGPVHCSDVTTVVLFDVHLGSKCSGTGAHAFGFTKWKADLFLASMDKVADLIGSPRYKMYFDQLLYAHGRIIHPIWTLGMNLRSPIDADHVGLLYQDRVLFPSTIRT